MQRSGRATKVLNDSMQTLEIDHEMAAASGGAKCQDMARKRLRSDCYKMEHQKPTNLTNLYLKEERAMDATRLESLLDAKWYDDTRKYKIMSKISPKENDRLNKILY